METMEEEELEAQMYAMLHHVDSEVPDPMCEPAIQQVSVSQYKPNTGRYWNQGNEEYTSRYAISNPIISNPRLSQQSINKNIANVEKSVIKNVSNIEKSTDLDSNLNKEQDGGESVSVATIENFNDPLQVADLISVAANEGDKDPDEKDEVIIEENSTESLKDKNKFNLDEIKSKSLSFPKKEDKTVDLSKNVTSYIDLDTSDEDCVIAVELDAPTPICIVSSEGEMTENVTPNEQRKKKKKKKKNKSTQRINPLHSSTLQVDASKSTQVVKDKQLNDGAPKKKKGRTSPVPSVMSSISDEFIQADCSTLNITSAPNLSFDFRLHGADLCGDSAVNLETESSGKKSKKQNKSTLITSEKNERNTEEEELFATPRSKSKQKSVAKDYSVPDSSYVPPSLDIYESESSDIPESVVDVPIVSKKAKNTSKRLSFDEEIEEEDTLVMGNVIGMNPTLNEEDSNTEDVVTSPKNKLKDVALHTMTVEDIEKYYNEKSGEDFDHFKIKKQMPRDKELWKLDPADMYKSGRGSRKITCEACGRTGHKANNCFRKPKICGMCGSPGHTDVRCPNKICLNCGSPSAYFSTSCRDCAWWKKTCCGICSEYGHPDERCPDLWRRYHLTLKNEIPLIQETLNPLENQFHCSGCTKRGHLIHTCKKYIRFVDFKPASPFIHNYSPVYTPDGIREPSPAKETQAGTKKNMEKRKSDAKIGGVNSPAKKKFNSFSETTESSSPGKRKSNSLSEAAVSDSNLTVKKNTVVETSAAVSDVSTKAESSNLNAEVIVVEDSTAKKDASNVCSEVIEISDGSPVKNVDTMKKNLTNSAVDAKRKSQNIGEESQLSLNVTMPLSRRGAAKSKVYIMTQSVKNNSLISAATGQENIGPLVVNTSKDLKDLVTEFSRTTSYSMLLTPENASLLTSPPGMKYLNKLSKKFAIQVKYEFKDGLGHTLQMVDSLGNHASFQNELKQWMESFLKPAAREREQNGLPRRHIPKKKLAAIALLCNDLKLLEKNLGNPQQIYQMLQKHQSALHKCKSKKNVNVVEVTAIVKKINQKRRSLNMILLGQGGLCNGREIFNKLSEMVHVLKQRPNDDLPNKLRDQIGILYESIFSVVPRNDYVYLIDEYLKGATHNVGSTTPLRVTHNVGSTAPLKLTHNVGSNVPLRVTHNVGSNAPFGAMHNVGSNEHFRATRYATEEAISEIHKQKLRAKAMAQVRMLRKLFTAKCKGDLLDPGVKNMFRALDRCQGRIKTEGMVRSEGIPHWLKKMTQRVNNFNFGKKKQRQFI